MVDRPDFNYYRPEPKACEAIYRDEGVEPVRCDLEAGHPGPHVHHYAMQDWSWRG